jgi:hypothetical protein
MRTVKLALALAVLALALGGCASSGAGTDGTSSSSGEAATRQPVACNCIGLQCLFTGCQGEPIPYEFPTPSSEPFRDWAQVQGGQLTTAAALYSGYDWQWDATGASASPPRFHGGSGNVSFLYDEERELRQFAGFLVAGPPQALSALGFPGLEEVRSERHTWMPEFHAVGVIANPYTLGWEYQSFGAWNSIYFPGGEVTAVSFGASTPASSIPVSGQASFVGQLTGRYVSPDGAGYTAAAATSVSVNFQARELGFASTGTVLTRDFATAVQAPSLNLNGTLTYAPGASAFSGTLANQAGTLSGTTDGRFYGPAAQELGGVFLLKSESTPEQFVGAYGAKR